MEIWIFSAILLANHRGWAQGDGFAACLHDPKVQQSRSVELQKVVHADQNDYRKEIEAHPDRPLNTKKLVKMAQSDLQRRNRIAEIFAEGCFKTADDYSAAALVYQHGEVADHYFQAFTWAKKSFELGDASQKSLMALALDRYLVRSGHKQLFVTQADKASGSACWCLNPVEDSFPDSMRLEYRGKTAADGIAWLKSMNGANNCPATYCAQELKPSPAGTIVGFW